MDIYCCSILSEKFYDAEKTQRDPQFVILVKAAEKVYTAAADGVLKQAKMMLPPHYTFHSKVCTETSQNDVVPSLHIPQYSMYRNGPKWCYPHYTFHSKVCTEKGQNDATLTTHSIGKYALKQAKMMLPSHYTFHSKVCTETGQNDATLSLHIPQ